LQTSTHQHFIVALNIFLGLHAVHRNGFKWRGFAAGSNEKGEAKQCAKNCCAVRTVHTVHSGVGLGLEP